MTFNERPGLWRTAFSKPLIEINLGGDAAGPLPANVEMARAYEAQLERGLSEAVAYVAKHVAEAFAVTGSPEIEWIDFGLSNYGERREFELFFSDEGTYVLWTVRFGFKADPQPGGAAKLFPVGFSRRRW